MLYVAYNIVVEDREIELVLLPSRISAPFAYGINGIV